MTPWGKYYRTSDGFARPTKAAAGMMETAKRSNHFLEGDALTLAVRGTTDTLAATNKMKRYRSKHYEVHTVQRWVKRD